MRDTSSLRPQALIDATRRSAAIGSRLGQEARLLGDAMDRFRARCTEYHVQGSDGVEWQIVDAEHQFARLDDWARDIAGDFFQADGGYFGGDLPAEPAVPDIPPTHDPADVIPIGQIWVAELSRWLQASLAELEQGFAAASAALEASLRASFSSLGLLAVEALKL